MENLLRNRQRAVNIGVIALLAALVGGLSINPKLSIELGAFGIMVIFVVVWPELPALLGLSAIFNIIPFVRLGDTAVLGQLRGYDIGLIVEILVGIRLFISVGRVPLKSGFALPVTLIFLLAILELFRSHQMYGQSYLLIFLMERSLFFYILFFVVLLLKMYNPRAIVRATRVLAPLVVVYAVAYGAQTFGHLPLNNFTHPTKSYAQDGLTRIYTDALDPLWIGLMASFYYLFERRGPVVWRFSTAFLAALFFVDVLGDLSRAVVVAVVAGPVLLAVKMRHTKSARFILLGAGAILLMYALTINGIIPVQSHFLSRMTGVFNALSSKTGTVGVRLTALPPYLDLWKHHVWLGAGYDHPGEPGYVYWYLPDGTVDSDLGFVNGLSATGVIGLGLVVWIWVKILLVKREKFREYSVLEKASHAFLVGAIVGSVTLPTYFLSASGIAAVSFALAILYPLDSVGVIKRDYLLMRAGSEWRSISVGSEWNYEI